MNKIKKWVAGATLMAMAAASVNSLDAQEYYDYVEGGGYEDSYSMSDLTPYIALGTVAVIAIVILAVRHHHGGGHDSSGHGH